MGGKDDGQQNISVNRKAFHEYFIDARYEAGMVLVGSEVKSLRGGRATLQDAYAKVIDGECWLYSCHISPFEQASQFNHEPLRPRKLLLRKREIHELAAATQQKGLTVVPLRLYWSGGRAKCELGVGRGKKSYDKRESLKERETQREIDRVVRARNRG